MHEPTGFAAEFIVECKNEVKDDHNLVRPEQLGRGFIIRWENLKEQFFRGIALRI